MRTPRAAEELRFYLEGQLLKSSLEIPADGEYEPAYTGRVLSPFLKSRLLLRVKSRNIHFHGDGLSVRAYSRALLGLKFFPDIAILEGKDKYWCAEVKMVRNGLSGDLLSKAIGQAAIYRKEFPFVTIILVRADLKSSGLSNTTEVFDDWLDIVQIRSFSNHK